MRCTCADLLSHADAHTHIHTHCIGIECTEGANTGGSHIDMNVQENANAHTHTHKLMRARLTNSRTPRTATTM